MLCCRTLILIIILLSEIDFSILRKIVILGPESTGKSTLCELLAQHYECTWCPEFAREYLLTHGMNYSYGDLLTIARGQVAMEEEFIQSAIHNQQSTLFIDTDMYVMKVWCEFVFGKCHKWITDQIAKRRYDLYLLCDVDLPWVKDELREYPDIETRQELYSIYMQTLKNQPVPWVAISGDYEQRLQKAISATDELLK